MRAMVCGWGSLKYIFNEAKDAFTLREAHPRHVQCLCCEIEVRNGQPIESESAKSAAE